MKNILYIVSTLQRCGPVNQLSYIIKYLDKNKFNPIILTLSKELDGDTMINHFTNILNVKVETLGLGRLKGLLLAKSKIKSFIKNNNIDLVHTQGIRADKLISQIDIASVATLRNYPYYDYIMTYGFIKGNIMAKLHLNALLKIDAPVVVSKSISNMLKNKNNYIIDFIRNGVDIERFKNLNKTILRKKLNLEINDTLLISIGNITSRKDPFTIIKAFEKVNLTNFKLLFLGDGDMLEECKNKTKNNKNIIFYGKVNNVNEYLGASDYFISSSLAEGLPNTVLEAMACGLPCILSDIPPHTEIHKIDKESSYIFPINDIDTLSKLIENIQHSNYIKMSNASKLIVNEYLSASIMSSNYQKLYLDILFKKGLK